MTEEEKKLYNEKMTDLWLMINDLDDIFEKTNDKKRQKILDRIVELTRALNNDTMTPAKVQEEANKLRIEIKSNE